MFEDNIMLSKLSKKQLKEMLLASENKRYTADDFGDNWPLKFKNYQASSKNLPKYVKNNINQESTIEKTEEDSITLNEDEGLLEVKIIRGVLFIKKIVFGLDSYVKLEFK